MQIVKDHFLGIHKVQQRTRCERARLHWRPIRISIREFSTAQNGFPWSFRDTGRPHKSAQQALAVAGDRTRNGAPTNDRQACVDTAALPNCQATLIEDFRFVLAAASESRSSSDHDEEALDGLRGEEENKKKT